MDSYYLFYWISIWNGTELRCGRSSQVLLPPCVCALLESPELFEKLVRTDSEAIQLSSTSDDNGVGSSESTAFASKTFHTNFVHSYRDIDVELALISMLSQQEEEHLLSSCSMSMMSHTFRSTLHNIPSPLPQHDNSGPIRTTTLPDTTLLTPAAGLIGWLSGGKVNRNKFLEASIHMTMLPFLLMRNVYETDQSRSEHKSPKS